MRPLRPLHALLTLPALLFATGAWAADPYEWLAPTPRTQVQEDRVQVEAGDGALFVPAMTAPDEEPRVLIVDDDHVRPARVGQKVPLSPGRYVVLVGSGGPDHSVGVPVQVEESRVTLVPVTWGGLRVEAVNPKLEVVDARLQLVQVETGEPIEAMPELWVGDDAPATWLLEPGLYRVQQEDSEGALRPDFATVHVPEAGLAKLRVFVDRAGRLRGAGIVETDDVLEDKERGPWAGSLDIGLQASGMQQRNAVGRQDFALIEGGLFVDAHLDFLTDRHQVSFDLDVEEGALFLQPAAGRALPWIKSQDDLRTLLSYTFLLNEGTGIYARGGLQAQVFPTYAVAAEPMTVEYHERDGSVRTVVVDAAETYTLNEEFMNPLALETGVGLRSKLSTHRDLEISLRAGAGARYYQFGSSYLVDDRPRTEQLEVRAIDDFLVYGPEVGATVGVRLSGFASYRGDVDWLGPLAELDRFIVDSRHSLTLRFTRALSVSYRLDVAYVPQITEAVMLRQGLSLRFGWSVL